MIVTRHIKNSNVLATKIQQAYLKNEPFVGSVRPDIIKNLPNHIIKILFEKNWLSNYWQYLPDTAPWENLDLEKAEIKYTTLSILLNDPNIANKLPKNPTLHIINYRFKDIPLPNEVPKKIILNGTLYNSLSFSSKIETIEKIINILKYMDHKETEIIFKIFFIYRDIHANTILEKYNKFENEMLMYLFIQTTKFEDIKKILLKPLPINNSYLRYKRIDYLKKQGYLDINTSTLKYLGSMTEINKMDFTNKNKPAF